MNSSTEDIVGMMKKPTSTIMRNFREKIMMIYTEIRND